MRPPPSAHTSATPRPRSKRVFPARGGCSGVSSPASRTTPSKTCANLSRSPSPCTPTAISNTCCALLLDIFISFVQCGVAMLNYAFLSLFLGAFVALRFGVSMETFQLVYALSLVAGVAAFIAGKKRCEFVSLLTRGLLVVAVFCAFPAFGLMPCAVILTIAAACAITVAAFVAASRAIPLHTALALILWDIST